jgi:hypothetical protein
MARHQVMLAAFLMQPDVPSGPARPQILDLHPQGGVDAGKAVGEGCDQHSVPKIAKGCRRYGSEVLAPFLALEHRRLAGLDDVLRATACRMPHVMFIVGVIAGTSRGIGSMGLIILLIILIFLFGGGGFYYGSPIPLLWRWLRPDPADHPFDSLVQAKNLTCRNGA